MNGPKINSTDRIVEYQGNPERGVWNDMGVLQGWDHFDYLGQFNSDYSDPRPFFDRLANYVSALPEQVDDTSKVSMFKYSYIASVFY